MNLQRARIVFSLALFAAACSNNPQNTSASVDPSRSTLTADRTSGITADGRDQVNLTATLVNASGQPLSGLGVTFSATGDGNQITQFSGGLSDDNGRTSAVLTSTAIGTKTVSVMVNGGSRLTQTVDVTFGAGAAAKLAFVQQPMTSASGATIAPPVQVAIEDAEGNILTSSSAPITLAIATNAGGGELAGTLTQNANQGVATFGDLSIDRAAHGYSLLASSSGVPAATSAPFDIGIGSACAAQSSIIVSPASLAAGQSTIVIVQLADCAGNPLPNTPLTLSASGSNNLFTAGSSSGATLSGQTNASALFIASLSSSTAQNESVSVALQGGSSPLLTTPVNFVDQPNALRVAVVAAPGQVAADGSTQATLLVSVTDHTGAPVSGQAVTLTASGADNVFSAEGLTSGSTLSGTTAADGTFSAELASTKAETKIITALAGESSASAVVTFVAGLRDATRSTILATPTTTPTVADGVQIYELSLVVPRAIPASTTSSPPVSSARPSPRAPPTRPAASRRPSPPPPPGRSSSPRRSATRWSARTSPLSPARRRRAARK